MRHETICEEALQFPLSLLTHTAPSLQPAAPRRLESTLLSANAQDALYARKLAIQERSVRRRLRELVYECVGEFEKGRLRGERRGEFLERSVGKLVVAKVRKPHVTDSVHSN